MIWKTTNWRRDARGRVEVEWCQDAKYREYDLSVGHWGKGYYWYVLRQNKQIDVGRGRDSTLEGAQQKAIACADRDRARRKQGQPDDPPLPEAMIPAQFIDLLEGVAYQFGVYDPSSHQHEWVLSQMERMCHQNLGAFKVHFACVDAGGYPKLAGVCEIDDTNAEFWDLHLNVDREHRGGLVGPGLVYCALRDLPRESGEIVTMLTTEGRPIFQRLFAFSVDDEEFGEPYEARKQWDAQRGWFRGARPGVLRTLEQFTSATL